MLRTILLTSLIVGPAFAQDADANKQIAELTGLLHRLESRIDELESRLNAAVPAANAPAQQTPVAQSAASPAAQPPSSPVNAPPSDAGLLRGTTVNFLLDAYYGYNFNDPIGPEFSAGGRCSGRWFALHGGPRRGLLPLPVPPSGAFRIE